jgi:hypothetical protein
VFRLHGADAAQRHRETKRDTEIFLTTEFVPKKITSVSLFLNPVALCVTEGAVYVLRAHGADAARSYREKKRTTEL